MLVLGATGSVRRTMHALPMPGDFLSAAPSG
jgi:hypothetical protein